MKSNSTKKLAIAGILCAVAVVGSMFSFPVFGSKCAPVQHMVNILCAVFLGPGFGVAAAFVASLLRNLMGLGSLLAFPGSMCGALLCGVAYWKSKNLPVTLSAFGSSASTTEGIPIVTAPIMVRFCGVKGRGSTTSINNSASNVLYMVFIM